MTRLGWLVRMTIAAVVFIPAGVVWADEPLRVLFFGNSFTHQHDVPRLVSQLAEADGHATPIVVRAAKSGRPLAYHLEQIAESPGDNVDHPNIADKTWDFVVIQGHSIEATHLGNPDVFQTNAERLFTAVRDHSSGRGTGVRAILYQTWARETAHGLYPNAFASPNDMQAAVVEQYRLADERIRERHGVGASRVAPVGEAFAAMDFERSLYGGDLYHAARSGAVLAAMVLYRTAYDEQVGDIAYEAVSDWAQVDVETWQRLAEVADAVEIGAE